MAQVLGPSTPQKNGTQYIPPSAQRDIEKRISGHGVTVNPDRLEPESRIIRASDVLLSVTGVPENGITETPPGVENFQEVLRTFPPYRDDDGANAEIVDAKCPDCDAIFFSTDELKQHYLTKYCPGTSVAVYVMTRDRDTAWKNVSFRSMQDLFGFFAGNVSGHLPSQMVKWCQDKQTPCRSLIAQIAQRSVTSRRCAVKPTWTAGNKRRYEPILNDPRDDASIRDLQKDLVSSGYPKGPSHSRSSSLVQRPLTSSSFAAPRNSAGEQTFARRAKRLRESISFKKFPQNDDDELVAVSFAGLYDLEKVHAPNGIFQQYEGNTSDPLPKELSDVNLDGHTTDPKRSTTTLCGAEDRRDASTDSDNNVVEDMKAPRSPAVSRRQSLFRKIFGRKITKGLSRANSTTRRSKKLIRKANNVRFSFGTKEPNHIRTPTAMSERVLNDVHMQDAMRSNNELSATPAPVPEYAAILQELQDIFVHMPYLPGGVIVHDASGRQRMLKVGEIAQLFAQLNAQMSTASIWSRTIHTRLRAESSLRAGNFRAAVVDLHDALKMLEDTPALDGDNLSRAGMLHSLGQAYGKLDMPAESEACYLESLGLYKRSLGRDHCMNYAVLQDLGELCERDGYTSEAAALYERSFAGRLKNLGHNDPDTLNSMQDLASLKVSLGDLESALLLLERAVPALDTIFGLQNEKTLNSMNILSLLYQKLGLDKQSHAICGRTIPPCKSFFGLSGTITRDAVIRYIQTSENYDFPTDIRDIIDQYRHSRDADALRVVHRLGRAYMDAGLNQDAAELFHDLFHDFLDIKGPEAPESFDALSALCVSREHLDSVDQAIYSYTQLVQMARKTPQEHHSRKRITYAEKRVTELNRRRDVLAAERKEWGLHEPAQCANCENTTTTLCNTCKISRFCSEPCHNAAVPSHRHHCLPSVSLRESKSLAVRPKCPPSMRETVISRIQSSASNDSLSPKTVSVSASYTFYLDPRNFSTFRMKLRSNGNTTVLFSHDSEIRYTTLTATGGGSSVSPENVSETSPAQLDWQTPSTQDSITLTPPPDADPSTATYLVVTPGKEMLKSLVDRRVRVRHGEGGREKDRFRALEVPDVELIEYAQGLLLTGYMGEAFMYVVEWEWK